MNATIDTEGRGHVPRLDAGGQPPSQKPNVPTKPRSAFWLITGLLILSSLPLIAGVFRLLQLASKREEGRFLSETPNRLHPDGQAVSVQCRGRLAAG